MDVRFAHLCDYALISNDGKLSVLGIFSAIRVRDLPAQHPRASLAFEIELNHAEVGKSIRLRIELTDADGRKLFTANADLVVEGQAKLGENPRFSQIMTLNNMRFEQSGAHVFNFWLGDSLKHQLTFEVQVMAQQPPQITGREPPQLPAD